MARKPLPNGHISSGFGWRTITLPEKATEKQFHPGIDIGDHAPDPQIIAPYAGLIVEAGFSPTFGNRIWVRIEGGKYNKMHYVLAHMKSLDPSIKKGNLINEGDKVGIMGSTGLSLAPHTHFEIRERPDVPGVGVQEPTEIINLYKS